MRNLLLWIEQNNRIADTPGGELADNWTRLRQEWFEVETLTGNEQQTQGNSEALATHKLKSVFIAGMKPKLRLTYGDDKDNPSRVFNVEAVQDINEKHRNLQWMVTEIVK